VRGGEIGSNKQIVDEGTVLLCKINPRINRSWVVSSHTANQKIASTEWITFLPNEAFEPKYLAYYLKQDAVRDFLAANASGVGGSLMRVKPATLKDYPFPLAPLDQQKRIVAEIEKQFSRLDEAVANLKRVKANLKRYKAAVLQAAVEGRLVETEAEIARREDCSYETGAQLLQRILETRRSQWLARANKAGGKGKGKYKEPAVPDTTDLPELPEGWVWATLGMILSDIEAGKSFKCEERPPMKDEIGVVKVSAVTWGEFDESESKTCRDKRLVNEKLLVRSGDFLFSRANTIELVGACVIAKKVISNVMLSDKILRFRLLSGLEQWVLYNLRSTFGREEIERLATGNQESMRNIGQDRIRAIRIPLPPLDECKRIVADIERRFSLVGETEGQINANLKRAERLRQSTLHVMFKWGNSAAHSKHATSHC